MEGDDVLSYGASLPVPNVQEMVRRNPLEVPERYIRAEEGVLEINNFLSPEIPVIDMSYLSRGCPGELEKLHKACEKWGFFQIWTNGKYKSVEHRAVTNDENPRMSVASFLHPFDDVEIEPLAHMVDRERPCMLYKKVKYGEYLRNSMTRKLEGKAHTDVAKVEE